MGGGGERERERKRSKEELKLISPLDGCSFIHARTHARSRGGGLSRRCQGHLWGRMLEKERDRVERNDTKWESDKRVFLPPPRRAVPLCPDIV